MLNLDARPLKNSGVGMIELLITLVVTSVGLLGLAALQVTGLRNNQFAYNHTQAITLASDISDRMRTNSDAVKAGNYIQATNNTAYSSCLTSAGCSANEMAKNDTYEWHELIVERLPLGNGLVCIDSTPNSTDTPASPACDGLGKDYTIKIWWDDDRDGNLDNPFILSFRP
ncbi:MAG: type IV pilus modification protein PilV [Methylococcales bacterium]|nr:type IV pilus modification protein PilV [Methylococcales bacterium]